MEAARTEQLMRLLSRHQDELFRYIFALLPHEEDAKDVLQETSVALYRKFPDYDPGKPFLPWAFGFAFLEILKQRERNQRGTRFLRQELVERLMLEREPLEPVLHERLQALDHCLAALPPDDRELIRRRYESKACTAELMQLSGDSRRTLFRRLERIRRQLFDCVSRRVATTGSA